MNEALYGLISAFLGALGPVLMVGIQERSSRRTEIVKIAVEAAFEKLRHFLEIRQGMETIFHSLGEAILSNADLLESIQEGTISPEKFLKDRARNGIPLTK